MDDVEPLQNLLASVRCAHSPLPPIPALPALHRGDVIEIQGPAASGKTHLLYHILLSLLSPGTQIAAVVYDTDLSFDVQRFRHLLLSRTTTLESVRRSLESLHLFRPTSLAQLAASIVNLPAYHSSHMPNQEIAVLAVDSISTFHWADRFAAEQLRSIGPEKVNMIPPLRSVLDAIQGVRRSHRPLVVLTNWALSPALSRSPAVYKQHLHPFPVVEGPGAKASISPHHSSSSPFHLAYHIALSSPSSDRQIRCSTKSSKVQDFAFQITDDDILTHPPESIRPLIIYACCT